jgi:hypothetical protein
MQTALRERVYGKARALRHVGIRPYAAQTWCLGPPFPNVGSELMVRSSTCRTPRKLSPRLCGVFWAMAQSAVNGQESHQSEGRLQNKSRFSHHHIEIASF